MGDGKNYDMNADKQMTGCEIALLVLAVTAGFSFMICLLVCPVFIYDWWKKKQQAKIIQEQDNQNNNDIPRAAIAAQDQQFRQGNNNDIPPAAMAPPQYPTGPNQSMVTVAFKDKNGKISHAMVPGIAEPAKKLTNRDY